MWNLIFTAGLLAAIAVGTSGYEKYNTRSAVCCSSQVLPFPETSDEDDSYGCCYGNDDTSVLYNYQTQTCCDGKVLDVPDDDHYYGCCNGEIYNSDTHDCCSDNLIDRNGDTNTQCCGDELYDVSEQICCSSWDEEDNYVSKVWDNQDGKAHCCGLESYNPKDSMCCESKVLPKPDTYDSSANVECCGGIPYNTLEQLCCSEYEKEDGLWHVKGQEVITIEGNKNTCCGLQLFDYHEEVCCTENDVVLPKPEGADKDSWMECCGDQVLTDYNTHICRDGQIVDRESSDIRVCGDQMYDYRNQSCCDDKYVYDDNSDISCCYEAGELVDYKTQLCCGSEVIDKSEEDEDAGFDACCN